MTWGNKPTDGGFLLLDVKGRDQLLRSEPKSGRFIRPFRGGEEFLHGQERWCLWLTEATPRDLRQLPEVRKRVEEVARFRGDSKAASTRAYARFPTLFRQIAQPESDYLAVPEFSSEKRRYLPIGFLSKDVICSNKLQVVPNATFYHFGLLSSAMHMGWMRQVCGRLESR
jgi:hypothetical protein